MEAAAEVMEAADTAVNLDKTKSNTPLQATGYLNLAVYMFPLTLQDTSHRRCAHLRSRPGQEFLQSSRASNTIHLPGSFR